MGLFSRIAGWLHLQNKEPKRTEETDEVPAALSFYQNSDPYRGDDEEYASRLREEVQKFSRMAKVDLFSALRGREPSRELLMGASLHKDKDVRLLAARNKQTPSECLCALALDSVEEVRGALLNNSNTPAEALLSLVNNKKDGHFMLIAGHPNTPAEALEILRQENNPSIDGHLLQNPNVPMSILEALSESTNDYIRKLARANRALQRRRLEGLSAPEVSSTDLVRYAEYPNTEIRAAVARHVRCPERVLSQLSGDLHLHVRLAVAKNPSTLASTLEKLSHDHSPTLREAILSNPNTLAEALQLVYDKVKTPSRAFQLALLSNANTPIKILEEYKDSRVEQYRLLVAKHPKVTTEILELLAKDRSANVKKAALEGISTRRAGV